MNSKKQQHIINNLLNSPELLGRCMGILKSEYFDPEYIPHVQFLLDYHHEHNTNPSVKLMNAEADADNIYEKYVVPTDEIDHSAAEVENFCKQCAMRDAVSESFPLIQKGDFGAVYKMVSEALNVSLATDLGIDVFAEPDERLKELSKSLNHISCGIRTWDDLMGGGNLRKQLQIVSANSGGGKSVCLSNIANNYVLQGLDVLYISLELPPEMVFLRQAYIMTSASHREWKSKIFEIAEKMKHFKELGAGDFRIIRLPGGSNCNQFRSYIKQYEIEHGKPPDVLIIDYMDLMSPISKMHAQRGLSEEDKAKSEDIYELLHAYDMIGWTASQQNRDALKMNEPNQSVIAGGLSKINICDNWLSVFMSSDMRLEGEMLTYAFKTRWADGAGKKALLAYDSETLRVSDHESPNKYEDLLAKIKKKNDDKAEKGSNMLDKLVENGHISAPSKERTQEDEMAENKLDVLKRQLVDFEGEDSEETTQLREEIDNELDLLDFRNAI